MNLEFVPIVASNVKSEKTYRRDLRSAVRGLWTGVIDFGQAFESMQNAIEIHFAQAWRVGAEKCGIAFNELTSEELRALRARTIAETRYISGYLEAIEQNSKANGGKLTPLFARLELWVNKWEGVVEEAQSLACANQKGVWRLGRTEKHCRSCSGLNGRVYRFSVWRSNGALPRSSRLECNGFRCDCTIEQTDLPITRGRFPASLLQ